MKYDFDKFIDRKNTNSVKWEFMNIMSPDVNEDTIPLWVADMDFPCSKSIIDALHRRVDREIFGYSSQHTTEYFNAVCGWYQRRFDWQVDRADIFYSPGVVPAISYLIEILTKPGEGIIIQNPVYYPFRMSIKALGRKIINNPLIDNEGYYEMNYEDLEEKAKDPNTTMIILCSPHNPVGRVWKQEELRKLGEICMKNDVFILSDEIHYDLIRRSIKHTPLEKVIPKYKNKIITATAPSKTFNLAGMQLSNIIIHDKAIKDKWNEYVIKKLHVRAPSTLAITATQAAYEEGEEWLEQVIDYLDENMKFIDIFLKENMPKAKCVAPEGTYLVWINLSAYGYLEDQLNKLMIKEAKVLLEVGSMFGEEGKGYVRLNVACPRNLLKKALENMSRVLEQRL